MNPVPSNLEKPVHQSPEQILSTGAVHEDPYVLVLVSGETDVTLPHLFALHHYFDVEITMEWTEMHPLS